MPRVSFQNPNASLGVTRPLPPRADPHAPNVSVDSDTGVFGDLAPASNLASQQFEDWLFHLLMPLAAYALLALSALAVSSHADEALFGVGAATLLLLFIGIHNAWDAVAYYVLVNKPDRKT